MRYPDQPVFVLADGGSGAPSAPAAPPSGSPSDGGGAAAPTQIARIPDSPDEAPAHDSFDGMENNEFDAIEIPPEGEPQVGETGAPPPSGEPAPQQVQQPATATPPAAPQQPGQVAAQQPADVPQAPRMPLDAAIEGFRTSHKELSNWASQNLFALSKEESEALETDAVAVIPQLMGKVYSQALQAMTHLIKNFVPEMVNQGVQSTNARNAKASEALQEFYAANQHLNPQQHGALVDKWARAFRAANPTASRADAIKFVGNAVSAELGIHAAPQGAGGAAKRPAPFAPARPGTRVQQPPPQNDPYEGMDMEYDR